MKKAGIVLAFIVMLCALVLPATGVLAATDGYYQLSEVSQPAWDSTYASRTKAPTADYDYTYGDESSVTYTLPWSFSFYGQSYTQITADTNGNIWFAATGSAHSFDLATTGRGPVIAAWNNDLSSYFNGGVFIQHKTNPERVVIEWQAETYSDEGTGRPNRFAVVLFPNGTIRTDYGAFSPTVGKDFGSGISRGDGTASLSLTTTYGNAFSLAGRSFLFASGSKIYVGSQTESFGDVPAGTASQPRTITLVNGGTDNLLISTVNLTANGSGMFSLAAGGDGCSGATLAPSQSCTVQAVFSPSALGLQSAVLSISSNDPTTPSLDIALTGTGLYPTLTVAKGDTGAGTVTSSPAGISCGTTCSGSFATGSTVTLTASPEAGSAFTGWSGACSGTGDCTVTMDTAKSVTASFTTTNPPTVTIFSPSGTVAGKRPLLQYNAGTGTVVVTVDGVVVSKTSGDTLDTLAEGTHVIRVEATNRG
uniref:Choice-of-anchor D domain-containing protein n=1 Tax=Geobacter metallireducens TaxID=28232 RepID=A0A831U6Y1_GEOME